MIGKEGRGSGTKRRLGDSIRVFCHRPTSVVCTYLLLSCFTLSGVNFVFTRKLCGVFNPYTFNSVTGFSNVINRIMTRQKIG